VVLEEKLFIATYPTVGKLWQIVIRI